MAESQVPATNPFSPQSPPPSVLEPSPPQPTEQVSTEISLLHELAASIRSTEAKTNLIYQEVMSLRYAMAVYNPRRKSRGLEQYKAAIEQSTPAAVLARHAAARIAAAAMTGGGAGGGAAAAGGAGAPSSEWVDSEAETEKEERMVDKEN
jgi:hypothetical protein